MEKKKGIKILAEKGSKECYFVRRANGTISLSTYNNVLRKLNLSKKQSECVRLTDINHYKYEFLDRKDGRDIIVICLCKKV